VKFHQKVKLKNKKSSNFGVFQLPEVRGKKKNHQIFLTWFLMCSKNVER
jgi:hypothetical protein